MRIPTNNTAPIIQIVLQIRSHRTRRSARESWSIQSGVENSHCQDSVCIQKFPKAYDSPRLRPGGVHTTPEGSPSASQLARCDVYSRRTSRSQVIMAPIHAGTRTKIKNGKIMIDINPRRGFFRTHVWPYLGERSVVYHLSRKAVPIEVFSS